MNGAGKTYHQEEGQHGHRSCSEASGYNPGYHLDISHPQHSKSMNFDNNSIDSYQYFNYRDQYNKNSECHSTNSRVEEDPRYVRKVPYREPLELPVPNFEIDENYVGEPVWTKGSGLPKVENSSDLDLDTRIDFLIKSKALAGMHPIFSQLESEESSNESDDPFKTNFRSKKKKFQTHSPPPVERVERFDDPEIPLSRPPSPFLSRATYLFWFNKAIELKKQAKAQEQALLEKAAKKLLHENSSTQSKADQEIVTGNCDVSLPHNVLDEVCSELKEIVKSEFIREVFEDAVFKTLEHWWESNCQKDSTTDTLLTSPKNSTKDKLPISSVAKSEISHCNIDSGESTVPAVVLTNDVKQINEMKTSPINSQNRVHDLKTTVNTSGNISKTQNTSVITASHEEADEFNILNEELVCGNGYSSSLNEIPRINQPILDESSLYLPFPQSSEVSEVPHLNCEAENEEKSDIVMYILNTILDNVPAVKT